jgi:hypothetical protein
VASREKQVGRMVSSVNSCSDRSAAQISPPDRTPLDAEVVDLEDRLIGIVGNEGAVWRPHVTRTELAHDRPP